MTTYNTGNPIGSKDPKDLYDNAENLDEAVNSTGEVWVDRRGVSRLTVQGAIKTMSARTFGTLSQLTASGVPSEGEWAVVTDDRPENNGYYRWSGSAWVRSALQPASDSVFNNIDHVSDSLSVEVEDRLSLIRENPEGGATISTSVDLFEDDVPDTKRAWVDADPSGSILISIDNNGRVHFNRSGPETTQTGLRAGLCHILGLGQSWMGGTGGAPAITTSPRAGIVMFSGGVRPEDFMSAPEAFDSIVPAVESNNAGDVRGETPMSGFARALADKIESEQGKTLSEMGTQLLVSVVAPGAAPLTSFAQMQRYFNDALAQVQFGYQRAQDLGLSYRLLCCPVILGKGDYDSGPVSQKGWEITFNGLVKVFNERVKSLVHDHPDIQFLIVQSGSHSHATELRPSVDLAIVEMDRVSPLICFAGTMANYQRSDSVHFNSQSYYDIGYVAGETAYEWIFSGKKPKVMLPVEILGQGRVISVRYNPPTLPVVLDPVGSGSPQDHGFEVLDEEGGALTIESITAAHDRVTIVLASTLPDHWELRYAWTGEYISNVVSGPRGSVRDSSAAARWSGLFQFFS